MQIDVNTAIALIIAVSSLAVNWGVMLSFKATSIREMEKLDLRIKENENKTILMEKENRETFLSLARIQTILESKLLPDIKEINFALKEHAKRAESLMQEVIHLKEGNGKGSRT